MTVVLLEAFRQKSKPQVQSFWPLSRLKQKEFMRHEVRSLGDIRTGLLKIGFTKDPTYSFGAYPDESDVNNKIVLNIDVSDSYYARIFGETFQISIMKFEDPHGYDFFKMETPISKSSGKFVDVIEFVENFINNNLKSDAKRINALVVNIK